MHDATSRPARSDDTPAPAPAVRVLGPVRVVGPDGAEHAPRGARSAALVVLLALAGPRGISATALVDRLWREVQPADPRAALQNLVSRLRGVVGRAAVRATETGYALGAVSDLDLVGEALAEARRELVAGAAAAAADRAQAALARWSGAAGSDLEGGEFAGVAAELREVAGGRQAGLRVVLRDAAEAAGRHALVAELAGADLAADPTDEDAARALMGALGGLGRPAEAVRVFTRLRSVLVRELGSEPGPATTALYEDLAVLAAPQAATPASSPAVSPAPAPATPPADGPAGARGPGTARGLRRYPTPLHGREGDVAAVLHALDEARLVTVLGPGGLGKTRLAQEVARRVAQGGSQVAVVELVGVRADEDVLLALADALGVAPGARSVRLSDRLQAGDLAGQVAASLRDSDALVVLDNCEHVVEGAAGWAAALLDVSPRLRVLATSRTPLLLDQERPYAPAPLGSYPGRDDGGPAVRLFVERARAVRPDALLDRAAVARLCTRLDGLPLAIELAAARVRTLSVAEVEARLDERFALLRVRDRSVPDRHRTLEAVLDWSWNLLSADQQALWRRTALLPDGFSAEAARALLPAAPGWQVDDAVDALVLQSLLRVEETDGATRYRMVETVREFGLLRLAAAGEERDAEDALLGWAQAVSRWCASRLLSRAQPEAVAELGREQENLVFAVRRAADVGRPEVVVHGFVALLGCWAVRGAEERIVGLVPTVLDSLVGWDVPEEHADATALALEVIASSGVFGVPGPAARSLARLDRLLRSSGAVGTRTRELAGLVLARTPEEIAAQLERLQGSPDAYTSLVGHMVGAQQRENDGELGRGIELAVAAHGLAVELGDTAATAMTAMMVASFLGESGDAPEAVRWVRAARGDLAAIGADALNPQVEWIELSAALTLGDVATADAVIETMADAFDERQGSRAAEAAGLVELGRGELAWLRGEPDAALAHLGRAVRTFGPGQPQGDAAPWFLLAASAVLVRRVQAGAGDDGLVRRIVEVGRRMRSAGRGYVDRPVLATSAIGVAAWACLAPEDRSGVSADRAGAAAEVPDAGRVGAGAELLALAQRLGGRQDLPALQLVPLREAVAASGPGAGAALDAAERRVAALRDDELVPRADELLVRLAQEADQGPGPGGLAQAFFM